MPVVVPDPVPDVLVAVVVVAGDNLPLDADAAYECAEDRLEFERTGGP